LMQTLPNLHFLLKKGCTVPLSIALSSNNYQKLDKKSQDAADCKHLQ